VPIKIALYHEIEAAAAPEAVIASSTSSLLWSDLAREMQHPERFLLAHPFNPPHLMPLVELYARDAALLDRAEQFYRALGRDTIRLKREAAGHVANRLASALWREAVNIIAEDIADVADVDRALVAGPGLRWSVIGAHMAYHLGGGAGGIGHYLEHLGPSQEKRWQTLGQPRLTPEICRKLVEGIAAEAAGRSVEELEAERDRQLMAILQLRAAANTPQK
jgi:3-hydroxyacyl-CoA dehydrogenase